MNLNLEQEAVMYRAYTLLAAAVNWPPVGFSECWVQDLLEKFGEIITEMEESGS